MDTAAETDSGGTGVAPRARPADGCCPAPAPDGVDRVSRLAKALADPIRVRMLDLMAQGRDCCGLIDPAERGVPGSGDPEGICVCEFQEHFELGQSKTSYHLKVLKDAGLVAEETRGKWTFYSVDEEAAAAALRELHGLLRV
jgi:ArsR family transcriptional regulator